MTDDLNKNQEAVERSAPFATLSEVAGDGVFSESCQHTKPTKFTAMLLFGPKEDSIMAEKVDQEVQKLLMNLRHMGGAMTLSIPPTRLKGEAIKLRDKCDELITLLGGE